MHLGQLRRAMAHPRTRSEKKRLLCLFLGLALVFCLVLVALVAYLHPSLGFMESESAEAWLRRHAVCPVDTLINVPPLRSTASRPGGTAVAGEEGGGGESAPPAGRWVSGGHAGPATVAGLHDFCTARVSAVPRWASGSWRAWSDPSKHLLDAAVFNLTIAPNFLANATYTAVGSPFCLAGGALYLPRERIAAGGTAVFEAERLTVLPLSDALLRSAAGSTVSAGLHVVPAMGLLLSGYWIATHFFHLVTDALETLYGAFHTMEGGVLAEIPTQTVMMHSMATDWVDRRGDQASKMEFSAALANAFSSPLLRTASPYNTSFLFRPDSRYCVGREARQPQAPGTNAAAAVCFCDGLLVTTHNHPFMDVRVYYGVQDWAARQFGAPAYAEPRSVRAMEALRLAHSASWAARFWPVEHIPAASPGATATLPAPPYRPRALFIHRTTRLIGNATQYAAWLREFGFHVEEVYMERLSAAQQYHLGRFADVVVGMHGLGIGHAMWMEREPHGCRSVIEFRPWVIQSMPLQPLRVLGQTMKYHFLPILPVDVRFGPSVKDPAAERELLLSMERVNSAFSYPSFTDQTAYYDDAEVRRVFWAVRQHLARCLPK